MELAQIITRFGASYRRRYAGRIPQAHLRAMDALASCRTAALGGHVVTCAGCGTVEYVYHSCRHRACPKCGRQRTTDWLEARRGELLPVPYFHVVFTVPQALRRTVRRHQRALYGPLLQAAAQSLMGLAADPRFVGGEIGIMAVLHTWARTLAYHPHVHCLVPAGGVAVDGTWRPVERGWLFPSRALAARFRGRFLALARAAVPGLAVPTSVFRTPWIVHLDPVRHGTDTVLRYLARYVHRVALTNTRLLGITGDGPDAHVALRYRDRTRQRWRTLRLRAHEFLRRFLQHVIAPGFHKVRYYGLWSATHKRRLHALRRRLDAARPDDSQRHPRSPAEPEPPSAPPCEPAPPPWRRCRACGGTLVLTAFLPPAPAPPRRRPP